MSRGSFSVTTECEVDIWPEDLEGYGYHHDDDCPAKTGKPCGHPEKQALDDAVDDLHQQAGHGKFPAKVCTTEPCRSLYLIPAAGAA